MKRKYTWSFESVVEEYCKGDAENGLNYQYYHRRYLQMYRDQASLHDAIRKAALSWWLPTTMRHPHQRRIPGSTLRECERRLQRRIKTLSRCTSFSALYLFVKDRIGDLPHVGALTIYDITLRIGAYMRLSPEFVYLHSGALIGARRLGVKGFVAHRGDFPTAFQRLTPAEIEDCLCVFADRLEKKDSPAFISA